MSRHGKTVTVMAALALGASMLAGCGGGEVRPETAALASAPLAKSQARLKIYRTSEFVGSLADARLKIDGRDAPALSDGEVRIVDVPAGKHEIVVDSWSHPNVFKLDVQAKAGVMYELEISPREEAVAAGMFGLAGLLIEAAANENGGSWQIKLVKQGPAA
jgi:hypothetical protein